MADFLPWMPLDWADFDAGTEAFDDAERVAYLRLLWAQWNQGDLPADLFKLRNIARQSASRFKLMWERSLGAKFVPVALGAVEVNQRLRAARVTIATGAGKKEPALYVSPAGGGLINVRLAFERVKAQLKSAAGLAGASGRWAANDATAYATASDLAGQNDATAYATASPNGGSEMRPHRTDLHVTDAYTPKDPPTPNSAHNQRARGASAPVRDPGAARDRRVELDDDRDDLLREIAAFVNIRGRAGIAGSSDMAHALLDLGTKLGPTLTPPLGPVDCARRAAEALAAIFASYSPKRTPRWTRRQLEDCAGDVEAIVAGDKEPPPKWTAAAARGTSAAETPPDPRFGMAPVFESEAAKAARAAPSTITVHSRASDDIDEVIPV